MNFATRDMSEADAQAIGNWRYPKPYDIYNCEDSEDNRRELLDGTYRAVSVQGELFGFYCTGTSAQVPAGEKFELYPEGPIDLVLGMKPDKTGAGRGADFLAFVLREVDCRHPGKPLRLTVAQFNSRAMGLYAKAGFVSVGEFTTDSASFQVMTKPSAGA